MAALKYVALDIYGTVLRADDYENNQGVQRGLAAFFDNCDARKIKVIGASDACVETVKFDLATTLENDRWLDPSMSLDRFFDFMQFRETPKEFRLILEKYNVVPAELLVIGDNADKDIQGAIEIGARYVHVPKYTCKRDFFDLSKVYLD